MSSKAASDTAPPTTSPSTLRQFPLCEGYLEKLALGRNPISGSRGWKRRYVFVLPEGLGTCHRNPRESSGAQAALAKDGTVHHLRPSVAKNFIPFEQRASTGTGHLYVRGDTVPTSCYLLTDLAMTRNSHVPCDTTANGITCDDVDPSADDHARRGSGAGTTRYFYFGVTFEEYRKRYTLFLRTPDALLYLQFTTYLRLYLHEGSRATVIPVAHPLELHHTPPVDVNIRKHVLGGGRGRAAEGPASASYYVPSRYTYVRDPDPCTTDELRKARQLVLSWDAGEMARLVVPAMHFIRGVRRTAVATPDAAERHVLGLRRRTPSEHARDVAARLDTVGALLPDGAYDQREGDEGPAAPQEAEAGAGPSGRAGAKRAEGEEPVSLPSENHNGLSDDTVRAANRRQPSAYHTDPLPVPEPAAAPAGPLAPDDRCVATEPFSATSSPGPTAARRGSGRKA
ncbi:hypothetical protein STCU_05579 [Strigomonas culicis]|uniref:PH domain-containing protein n=1 Tax=Strigomonas culicis TaxID=28005 RepID=S9UG84_9TRYP|nr:hypothetical protein STCU_05579 [Strigomonas culicis]|eukprot:EPY27759.1 hypothetical protein STCU_05579 [Strigomonas culicis]